MSVLTDLTEDLKLKVEFLLAKRKYSVEWPAADSPFHCLPAHQPLGSINRVRRLAYPSSSRFRHEQNVQPRREPQDISELPD